MGNRAVITTAPYREDNVGIYVHWNGGAESIEGFLRAAKELGFHDPASAPSYGMASLAGVIFTYLGLDGMSVGIGPCKELDTDNGDNGTYLVGPGFEIVDSGMPIGRNKFRSSGRHLRKDETKTDGIRKAIVERVQLARDHEEKGAK